MKDQRSAMSVQLAEKSEGGRLYFSINIHVLVDLIQREFNSQPNNKNGRLYEGVGSHGNQ
jgi:hypothetical protein